MNPQTARHRALRFVVQGRQFEFRFVTERRQQRHDFAELDLRGIERERDFLAREIDLRLADAGFEAEQIFQQPHTRDAMNGGNMKRDARQPLVSEIHQSLAHRWFVEEEKLIRFDRGADAHARCVAQFVKVRQTVGGKNLENRAATVTTEAFLLRRINRAATQRAAMKARRRARCFAVANRISRRAIDLAR